jgi:hypothetical protein
VSAVEKERIIEPASYFAPGPTTAIFLSYCPYDQSLVFDIAGNITRIGATVFLDEACIQADREPHILNALAVADEVLLLMTPTRVSPRPIPGSPPPIPGFLDRRYVWIALGVANARGIPLRGLLRDLTAKAVVEDTTIPKCIRDIERFDTLDSYLTYLQQSPKVRRKYTPRLGIRCRVCFYRIGRGPSISKLENRLKQEGIESNMWSKGSHVDTFDALVVVMGSQSVLHEPGDVRILQDFVNRSKPVVLLSFPGFAQQAPPGQFRAVRRIEYRDSDKLSFLQLVWAILGYKLYPSWKRVTVFISYSHDSPEHKERVLNLSRRLRNDGIDCCTDQDETSPEEGWPRWCRNRLLESDFVLVVCTETYKLRYEDKSPLGEGQGAKWEGFIITTLLYLGEGKNRKFVPIVFCQSDKQHIPFELAATNNYDLSTSDGYEQLLGRLRPEQRCQA